MRFNRLFIVVIMHTKYYMFTLPPTSSTIGLPHCLSLEPINEIKTKSKGRVPVLRLIGKTATHSVKSSVEFVALGKAADFTFID